MIKIYYNNYYNNIKKKIYENLSSNIKNSDFSTNFRFFISLFPFIFIINRSFQNIIDYFINREIRFLRK